MPNFVAIEYDDMFRAEEVRLTLLKLQREYLICMDDAVVAVKDENGKVKLHQSVNLTAAGAVSGALSDAGIDNNFMKKLSEGFKPGTSALFVLVRKSTPDKVVQEIKKYGGTVLHTSLSHEDEAKLQAALDEAQSPVHS